MRRPHRTLRAWWRDHWRRVLPFWGVGILASVVVTLASAFGYLEGTQARTLDLLLRLRGSALNADVVIVAVDQAAFDALGQRQPLPRDYLARVLLGLRRAGAAAVGLDVTLEAATTPEDDAALARAIREFADDGLSRVVLPSTAMPRSGALADPALLDAVVRGAPEMPEDADATTRRTVLLLPGPGGRFEPSFALAVVARLGGFTGRVLDDAVSTGRGELTLPELRRGALVRGASPLTVRAGELTRINFIGKAGSFLTIPADAVAALGEPDADVADANPFRGRPVLVGATFREGRDWLQTPHGAMTGVEVHANVVHMLLTRSFIRPSGWLVSLLLQILAVLATGVVFVSYPPITATIVSVGGMILVGFPASYAVFHRGSYWVDFMLPILATWFLGFGADTLERRRFKQAFGRYVGEEVTAHVLADAPELRGARREVSILFSDLRGFTTLSETTEPERIAGILDEYMDAMTAAIFKHRGMINDFVGDGIMGVFGAPLVDERHAEHAAAAALAMCEALEALNVRWAERGLPRLGMGIGIHSGGVFAGNVGGRARVKYTIVGDAVNVASRVEGLNKELGTTILITEVTRRLAGAGIETRDAGTREVKGRAEQVHVHELLGLGAGGATGGRGG